MTHYDLIVIGAGVAGITSAIAASREGISKILIIERENIIGGLLNECIHNGFGEKVVGMKVTGPEYIEFLKDELKNTSCEILLNTNVLDIKTNKTVTYVNSEEGVKEVNASAIVFAMGAKERYSGNVNIPTNALTGIFSVGEVHRMVNIEGYLPGKNAIITAKDKRGFILARRLIIEGGNISALVIEESFDDICNDEIRDIIDGFEFPIIDNAKVIGIQGKERIEDVILLNLENKQIIKTDCDCLILSVGFIPETEKLRKLKININETTLGPDVIDNETSLSGFFACGNIVFGEEALKTGELDGIDCGKSAANYIKAKGDVTQHE